MFGDKNLFDKNSKRMRCKGCGSEDHFIADCTIANKAKMVSLVMNHVRSVVSTLPFDYFFVQHNKYSHHQSFALGIYEFLTQVCESVVLSQLRPSWYFAQQRPHHRLKHHLD